ncbi:MAG: serine protease [Nitrosomonas ureae]
MMSISLITFWAQPDQISATAIPLIASSPTAFQLATPSEMYSTTPELMVTPAIIRDPLERSRQATVQVLVENDHEPGEFSAGSGSVITSQGHILTNFHVLGDPNTGQFFNRAGVVLIAISSSDMRSEPQVTYRAEIEQANRVDDLVLLRIIAFSNNTLLPTGFSMPYMPIGDSNTVQIGDEILILGYPDIGGRSITQTRGIVSGFVTSDNFFKTDAEINPGNSGGAAVNRDGLLIGIPTAGSIGEEFPGKLGLVRPINQAYPLIDRALNETKETP